MHETMTNVCVLCFEATMRVQLHVCGSDQEADAANEISFRDLEI